MSEINIENVAHNYHLKSDVPDKFIEDISQDYFCEWVKNKYNKNLNVCEMGYGEGITAQHLGEYFENYTVIEGASALSEQARLNNPNINIVNSMFETYEPSEKYDLVLALHVLEHVENPAKILEQVKKWLKPSGTLLTLVPNKNSLHRVFALNMSLIKNLDELSERDILVGHQRVYGLDELCRELNNCGFEVNEKMGFFLKSVPNSMMLNYDPRLVWQLNKISESLDPNILANICAIAKVK